MKVFARAVRGPNPEVSRSCLICPKEELVPGLGAQFVFERAAQRKDSDGLAAQTVLLKPRDVEAPLFSADQGPRGALVEGGGSLSLRPSGQGGEGAESEQGPKAGGEFPKQAMVGAL